MKKKKLNPRHSFYIRWNTLKRLDGFDEYYFNILPALEIIYSPRGFETFGGDETEVEWCKELNINFDFLCIRFNFTYWWDFYID